MNKVVHVITSLSFLWLILSFMSHKQFHAEEIYKQHLSIIDENKTTQLTLPDVHIKKLASHGNMNRPNGGGHSFGRNSFSARNNIQYNPTPHNNGHSFSSNNRTIYKKNTRSAYSDRSNRTRLPRSSKNNHFNHTISSKINRKSLGNTHTITTSKKNVSGKTTTNKKIHTNKIMPAAKRNTTKKSINAKSTNKNAALSKKQMGSKTSKKVINKKNAQKISRTKTTDKKVKHNKSSTDKKKVDKNKIVRKKANKKATGTQTSIKKGTKKGAQRKEVIKNNHKDNNHNSIKPHTMQPNSYNHHHWCNHRQHHYCYNGNNWCHNGYWGWGFGVSWSSYGWWGYGWNPFFYPAWGYWWFPGWGCWYYPYGPGYWYFPDWWAWYWPTWGFSAMLYAANYERPYLVVTKETTRPAYFAVYQEQKDTSGNVIFIQVEAPRIIDDNMRIYLKNRMPDEVIILANNSAKLGLRLSEDEAEALSIIELGNIKAIKKNTERGPLETGPIDKKDADQIAKAHKKTKAQRQKLLKAGEQVSKEDISKYRKKAEEAEQAVKNGKITLTDEDITESKDLKKNFNHEQS